MRKKLNNQSLSLLRYINEYLKAHNYAPTLREMMTKLGYSSTSVTEFQVRKLESAGLITRQFNKARSLCLTSDALKLLKDDAPGVSTLTLPLPPEHGEAVLQAVKRTLQDAGVVEENIRRVTVEWHDPEAPHVEVELCPC